LVACPAASMAAMVCLGSPACLGYAPLADFIVVYFHAVTLLSFHFTISTTRVTQLGELVR